MGGALEPPLAPQRNNYRLSRLCGRSQGEKFNCMYKWGGIYNQGWNYPLWLFDFPHDCDFNDFLDYMTLQIMSGSLGIPLYITFIDNIMAYSSDVANMTHDSSSMFMLLLVYMLSYNVVEWWMSSWCITFSPLHGKVRSLRWSLGSFDDACAHCSFVCTLACLTSLSIWDTVSSHVLSFVKLFLRMFHSFMKLSLHMLYSFAKLSLRMFHLFMNTPLFMYSPYSSHSSSRHVYSCTYISNHSWRDEIKSINLLVYHDAWSFTFGCRWLGESIRLWNYAR